MFQFIFGSFLVISIIGWPFFDTLFEANKNPKKYSRIKYRIEYYVIDCVKEFWGRVFDFKGKTRRRDFWLTLLVTFILNFLFVGLPLGLYVFYELVLKSRGDRIPTCDLVVPKHQQNKFIL